MLRHNRTKVGNHARVVFNCSVFVIIAGSRLVQPEHEVKSQEPGIRYPASGSKLYKRYNTSSSTQEPSSNAALVVVRVCWISTSYFLCITDAV